MTWTILILLPIAAIVALFAIKPLRRAVVTRPIFAAYRKMLPQMSQTEKEAIEAGSVWWEGELFHGRPDWNKLLAYPQPKLTPEEQSFLDNETCLLYTSDAADERSSVDLGGRRIIKKKKIRNCRETSY